jgi:spoIIIJ-associated protein
MKSKVLEIEEKSIDDAIEKACQEFGVPREKLNIEIISGESGGFLGLFSKKAKIKASLLSFDIDFSFADSSKPKEDSPKPKTENIKPKSEPKTKADFKKKPEKETIREKPRKHQEPAAEPTPRIIVKAPTPVVDDTPVPVSDVATKAKDLLEGILQRISPEYRVNAGETQEKIILSIEGDESGLLIGKRGQNLDALQYIMNKAVHKIDAEHKNILIDLGAYRKRREEFLMGLAEKIRDKVKTSKKPVSLGHMNAHDRRIIHMVLQEDESLTTQSRGEGKNRKIVILPAKTGNNRRHRGRKQE